MLPYHQYGVGRGHQRCRPLLKQISTKATTGYLWPHQEADEFLIAYEKAKSRNQSSNNHYAKKSTGHYEKKPSKSDLGRSKTNKTRKKMTVDEINLFKPSEMGSKMLKQAILDVC